MKNILISVFLVMLTACGWHLRGAETSGNTTAYNLPIELVITSKDNHGPLMNALLQDLRTYNITQVASGATAYYLDLDELNMDRRSAGVGSDALVSVYELILFIDYQIRSADKVLTSTNTRGSITRSYNFEVSQANYSEQEEALILREMHRDLAQQILRRLKVLAYQNAQAGKAQ